MFSKKNLPSIKSLIAESTQIVGDIVFAEGLRIDGQISGKVRAKDEADSILVISESAKVTGEVWADHVVINGSVTGPVVARKMLELQPKARIDGDIQYAALEMHQGALISGMLKPLLEDEEKPALKLAANNR